MKLVRALTFLVALLAGLFVTPTASAEESTNAVGDCLANDKVWLLVVDDEENVIANECVDSPETGDAALESAGVDVQRDANGFICAMGGVPEECPTEFNGQYWNYHHAVAGGAWEYYEVGSSESEPAPGSIEGWCYNAEGTENCTPPLLKVMQDGSVVVGDGVSESDLQDLEVTGNDDADASAEESETSDIPWLWIGIGGVVVVAVVAAFVVSRSKKSSNDTVGGR